MQFLQVRGFLKSISVELGFIDSMLPNFMLSGKDYSPLVICDTISKIVTSFDSSIEVNGVSEARIDKRTKAQKAEDTLRGKYSPGKGRIPHEFRPSIEVNRYLKAALGCDAYYVAKQARIYREQILLDEALKGFKLLKFDWERDFVNFFVLKFKSEIQAKSAASNTDQQIGPVTDKEHENVRQLGYISRELCRNFSIHSEPYPSNWIPSLELRNHLAGHGLHRKYIYCEPMIAAFRNECRLKKIPLRDANYEYCMFLIKNEELLVAIAK